jgi:tellurium resistance protein TerD
MAINLTKGGRINLAKEAPSLKVVRVGLGWKQNATDTGHDFDLDVTAFGLKMVNGDPKLAGRNDQPDFMVFYGNHQSIDGAITHSGDNRKGDTDGDDETVAVDLAKVPADVAKVIFAVNIHEGQQNGQNFGQVDRAYIRVINKDNANEEVARFDLSEDGSTETAMIFGELYRHNGEWKFKAVGQGFNGGLGALAASYGVAV